MRNYQEIKAAAACRRPSEALKQRRDVGVFTETTINLDNEKMGGSKLVP